jgi:Mrp family chromosome partitioning ATPase
MRQRIASSDSAHRSNGDVRQDPDGALIEAPEWPPHTRGQDKPVLTVDSRLMRDLAVRALSAGSGGLTKVGVASVQHGEGATTIARSLASCLSENFGQRVVLVEANQRSPCLRDVCGLQHGAGLADVLCGAATLEAALRVSRSAGKMLVLPASPALDGTAPVFPGEPLRDLMAELFFYADTLIFDLAPLLPYPDAVHYCRSLDGVAVVLRAGRSTRKDSATALQGLKQAGIPILGAVLNREKSAIPRLFSRWF